MDTSWDEYDAYDRSEFSTTDFVHIDNHTTGETTRHNNRATAPEEDKVVVIVTDGDWTHAVGTSGSGGLPQVAVELEPTTDEPVVVKVAGGASGNRDTIVIVDGASRRSPFEEFRSQTLSVSDLVGPAWCEVKFDYGLRQGRSLPLANRPDRFVTGDGKEITVNKKVAKVNEKVLEHGRSVHKKLEREIFPESVKIEPLSIEEYWAAYLVNMLTCLVTLVQLGCTHEMPVFGIVQLPDHWSYFRPG